MRSKPYAIPPRGGRPDRLQRGGPRGWNRRDFLSATAKSVAALSVLPVLSGCRPGDDNGAMRFVAAHYSGETPDFWSSFREDFAEETDAEVEIEVIGWEELPRQATTMVTTGELPEVLNHNVFAQYAADDLILPLEEVVSEELMGNFRENFLEAAEYEGVPYGVPFIASIRNLYYNVEIFEQAGIDAPPETWDELLEVAQTIQDETGVAGFGVPMTEFEGQAYFSYFVWGNGGDWQRDGEWSFDLPENVEAIDFLNSLVNDHQVTNPEPTAINRDELQRVFAQGEVGMMITANFFPTILEEEAPDLEWDLGPIPVNEGAEQFSLGVQDFLVAFDTGGDTEVVRSFFDHFFEDERYIDFLEREGMLPVTESASETMAAEDELNAEFIEQLPLARFYPVHEPGLDAVYTNVTEAVQRVLLGDQSAEESLQQLQEEVAGGE